MSDRMFIGGRSVTPSQVPEDTGSTHPSRQIEPPSTSTDQLDQETIRSTVESWVPPQSFFQKVKNFFTRLPETAKLAVREVPSLAALAAGTALIPTLANVVVNVLSVIPTALQAGLLVTSGIPVIHGLVDSISNALHLRGMTRPNPKTNGAPIKVSAREIMGRVALENVIPAVVGGAAVLGLGLGGIALSSTGVGAIIGVPMILAAAAVYYVANKPTSWLGKLLADRIFGKLPGHETLPEKAINRLRGKTAEADSEAPHLTDADSEALQLLDGPEEAVPDARPDSLLTKTNIDALQEALRGGSSPEFIAAMGREDNEVEAHVQGTGANLGASKWFKKSVYFNMNPAGDRGLDSLTALGIMDPRKGLEKAYPGRQIRNVDGGGNCWITSGQYACLKHFKDDQEYRQRLLSRPVGNTWREPEFFAMLQEIDSYLKADKQISNDQLMSLITSPQYGQMIRDFTRGLPGITGPAQAKDAYGDDRDLTALAKYFDAQLEHINMYNDGRAPELVVLNSLAAAKPLTGVVIIPPTPGSGKVGGHYLVLEPKEEGDLQGSFSNLSSATPSVRSLPSTDTSRTFYSVPSTPSSATPIATAEIGTQANTPDPEIARLQQEIDVLSAEQAMLIPLLGIQAARGNELEKVTLKLKAAQQEQERQIQRLSQSHADKELRLSNQVRDAQTRLEKAQNSLQQTKAEKEQLAALKRQLETSKVQDQQQLQAIRKKSNAQAEVIKQQNQKIQGMLGSFEHRERLGILQAEAESRAQLAQMQGFMNSVAATSAVQAKKFAETEKKLLMTKAFSKWKENTARKKFQRQLAQKEAEINTIKATDTASRAKVATLEAETARLETQSAKANQTYAEGLAQAAKTMTGLDQKALQSVEDLETAARKTVQALAQEHLSAIQQISAQLAAAKKQIATEEQARTVQLLQQAYDIRKADVVALETLTRTRAQKNSLDALEAIHAAEQAARTAGQTAAQKLQALQRDLNTATQAQVKLQKEIAVQSRTIEAQLDIVRAQEQAISNLSLELEKQQGQSSERVDELGEDLRVAQSRYEQNLRDLEQDLNARISTLLQKLDSETEHRNALARQYNDLSSKKEDLEKQLEQVRAESIESSEKAQSDLAFQEGIAFGFQVENTRLNNERAALNRGINHLNLELENRKKEIDALESDLSRIRRKPQTHDAATSTEEPQPVQVSTETDTSEAEEDIAKEGSDTFDTQVFNTKEQNNPELEFYLAQGQIPAGETELRNETQRALASILAKQNPAPTAEELAKAGRYALALGDMRSGEAVLLRYAAIGPVGTWILRPQPGSGNSAVRELYWRDRTMQRLCDQVSKKKTQFVNGDLLTALKSNVAARLQKAYPEDFESRITRISQVKELKVKPGSANFPERLLMRQIKTDKELPAGWDQKEPYLTLNKDWKAFATSRRINSADFAGFLRQPSLNGTNLNDIPELRAFLAARLDYHQLDLEPPAQGETLEASWARQAEQVGWPDGLRDLELIAERTLAGNGFDDEFLRTHFDDAGFKMMSQYVWPYIFNKEKPADYVDRVRTSMERALTLLADLPAEERAAYMIEVGKVIRGLRISEDKDPKEFFEDAKAQVAAFVRERAKKPTLEQYLRSNRVPQNIISALPLEAILKSQQDLSVGVKTLEKALIAAYNKLRTTTAFKGKIDISLVSFLNEIKIPYDKTFPGNGLQLPNSANLADNSSLFHNAATHILQHLRSELTKENNFEALLKRFE